METEVHLQAPSMDVNGLALFTMNSDGRITSWNADVGRVLGFSQHEFVGKSFSITFPPVDRQNAIPEQQLNKARETGRYENVGQFVNSAGETFLAETMLILLRDENNRPSGFARTLKRIGDKSAADNDFAAIQAESDRRERLYEAVTGSTPDLIYVFDLQYHFIYANAALLTMWGLNWESSNGKRLIEVGYEAWHAEMHEREIDQVVATKQPVRGTVSFPHATLGRRVYDYILVPVINDDGEVEAVAGTTRDITDIKQAEEALKSSGEKLEALVVERTRELQRSNEALQQFAHVASHDLKEPIRKVRTFTYRLLQEFGEALPERARSYLDKIERASERMGMMVEGVLAYSSFNRMEIGQDLIDLKDIITSIQTDLEVLVAEKKAVFNVGNLPTIRGTSVLIYQLFYNLVNNSLKFSRANVPSVIAVDCEYASAEDIATMQLDQSKKYWKLMLKDNGIGFAHKEADIIFELFSRLNSKDQYEGTGLGLSLCKTIAERHDGAIYADGKENEGAAFTVLLPV